MNKELLSYVKELHQQIKSQADALPDGWMELNLEAIPELKTPARTIKVPRIPFERWVHMAHKHRWEDWKNVSPSGLKMAMDDRNHSDWWIGAGLSLDHCHIREKEAKSKQEILAVQVNRAAWNERMDYGSYDGYLFLVKPRKTVEGMVMWVRNSTEVKEFVEEAIRWKKASNNQDMIAVVPNASIDFSLIMPHASAVITQEGNKVAHLVKVAREDNVPVVLCKEAFKRYFDGEQLSISKERVRRIR